jgi:ferrous iron transport protein A
MPPAFEGLWIMRAASKLSELSIKQSAKIARISAKNPRYRQQLLALGLTPGTKVTLLRVAPLGDPMVLKVRDFEFSLRRSEADLIDLKCLSHA